MSNKPLPRVTVSFTGDHYQVGILMAVHNLLVCDSRLTEEITVSSLDNLIVLLEMLADNAKYIVTELADGRPRNIKFLRTAGMKIVAAADAFLLQGEGGDDAGTV